MKNDIKMNEASQSFKIPDNEVIKVLDLVKTYANGSIEVQALKGINLTIRQGEFVAIMGTSGSGKSTLMNILGCLDRPTDGEYFLSGISIKTQSDDELSYIRNQQIGFVFQSFNLIPRTSALKNVELPMVYGKTAAEERHKRAMNLLESVGLGTRYQHMPNELSGGQLQRVCIARAVACKPEIILFDEAISSLDAHTQVQVMDLLRELKDRLGLTYIFITHDLTSITYLCDDVLFLYQGRVTENLPVERISETKDEYARKLLGSIVVFDTEESA